MSEYCQTCGEPVVVTGDVTKSYQSIARPVLDAVARLVKADDELRKVPARVEKAFPGKRTLCRSAALFAMTALDSAKAERALAVQAVINAARKVSK